MYHVSNNGETTEIKEITNQLEKHLILDDLNIKLSDFLQSNGIIWVEGPSDCIYIKHWLNLFYKDEFIEGVHYQFLLYGVKLLSHYNLEMYDNYSEEDKKDFIDILSINRNSAIILDSDKKEENADINEKNE